MMNWEYLSNREIEAVRHIRNSIMHKGRSPSVRELMALMGYRSPRSISLIVGSLINKGFLRRKPDSQLQIIKRVVDDSHWAQTVDVPLVGEVACGVPLLAEENTQAIIPISTSLARPPYRYFLLRANGDSMDEENINDGDLVLIRQQTTAEEGDLVVALIDDEATIKKFHASDDFIILKPRSSNKEHKPIVLTQDFQIQGVVITTIPNLHP